MGGYGSTRWGWHSAKDTVETTPSLSIATLQKYCQIGAPYLARGSFSWQPSGASVSYTLDGQALTLSYRMRRGPGDSWQDRKEVITLQTTRPNYGGRRWWLTCPICQRRAGVVYLDNGRFSCRQCAGLVYRSQQEHDKLLDRYAHNPGLADDMLGAIASAPGRASTAQLMQALKASEMQLRLFTRQARKYRH